MRKITTLITFTLILIAGLVARAGTPVNGVVEQEIVAAAPVTAPTTVTVTIPGKKVTVQRVALHRQLDWWEVSAIEEFMSCRKAHLSKENYDSLRNALYFLISWDDPSDGKRDGQSHVRKVFDKSGKLIGGKLDRTANEYWSDYQGPMGIFNSTNWYVNEPEQKIEVQVPVIQLPSYASGAVNIYNIDFVPQLVANVPCEQKVEVGCGCQEEARGCVQGQEIKQLLPGAMPWSETGRVKTIWATLSWCPIHRKLDTCDPNGRPPAPPQGPFLVAGTGQQMRAGQFGGSPIMNPGGCFPPFNPNQPAAPANHQNFDNGAPPVPK